MEAVFSLDPSLDKTVDVELPGWAKLKIEYSIEHHNGISYLCWRVQNTEQIFRVQTSIVYEKHGLEYSEHFVLTLTKFREDYLDWEAQEFPEDWMKRYNRMFQYLIIR